jgi:hypothetical protein
MLVPFDNRLTSAGRRTIDNYMLEPFIATRKILSDAPQGLV